jgi:hypothetical protein
MATMNSFGDTMRSKRRHDTTPLVSCRLVVARGVKRCFITPLLDAVTFAHDCGNGFNRSGSCLSRETARWRDPIDDLRE